MTSPPIEVEHASFQYHPDRPPVVRDVSLALRSGELLGVLGPNGAGKSTLLRLMAGLIAPSSGRVRIAGRDARQISRSEAARVVAVVPQREPAVFGFTAREVVAMGRAPHTGPFGGLSPHDHAVVDAALARCDAQAFGSRPLGELSGGEQKRVLIARALAQGAPIVLLDEPVAHLDVRHQLEVCELMARGVSAGEFTAVVVLHDLNLAAQYCDRVLLMREGAALALGTVAEVMTYQRLRTAFDAELYVGRNELNDTGFYVPMRVR